MAQSSFVFVNSDPFYDFPRPTLHKIVHISGLSVPKVKPLNKVFFKNLIWDRQDFFWGRGTKLLNSASIDGIGQK